MTFSGTGLVSAATPWPPDGTTYWSNGQWDLVLIRSNGAHVQIGDLGNRKCFAGDRVNEKALYKGSNVGGERQGRWPAKIQIRKRSGRYDLQIREWSRQGGFTAKTDYAPLYQIGKAKAKRLARTEGFLLRGVLGECRYL